MPNSDLPVENIPQCLRDRPQWVCWKYVQRDGKQTKVPVNPRYCWNASATDAQTWTTFDAAYEAYLRNDSLAGVGFVFSKEDPFAGIDLDRCLNDAGNFTWGQDVVDELATYTEVSPSGRGVKLFLKATKPAFAKCRRDGFGPDAQGELELYDQGRFFAVTGHPLAASRTEVASRQAELEALCQRLWPQPGEPVAKATLPPPMATARTDRLVDCLDSMLAMRIVDHNDGSYRLFSACCRCVEHDLGDADALACVRQYEGQRPFPTRWSDADVLRRLRDAERHCQRGAALGVVTDRTAPACKSVGQLLANYPELRPPVIHGLLRVGESMNVIAPSKLGKSWLVTDLALTVATGRRWLGTFETEAGNVLVLDNELHPETTANRIPKIALARNISMETIAETVYVDNLRGRLQDIFSLAPYFNTLQPGFFRIVVLDAFYRFLPKDTDENSNANLTDIYNQLDWYAAMLGCSFVLVHHASKGSQSGKSITDVGAGAGSQARATDTHLILRPHEEPDCVVLDAAVRSWPPIDSRCLRWTFPVWTPDDSLDPTALKPDRPRRRPEKTELDEPAEPQWTSQRFVDELVTDQPVQTEALIDAAVEVGLSQRQAKRWLRKAEAAGLIFRWSYGANRPVEFATVPQDQLATKAG
jgi:hypothetical protein